MLNPRHEGKIVLALMLANMALFIMLCEACP